MVNYYPPVTQGQNPGIVSVSTAWYREQAVNAFEWLTFSDPKTDITYVWASEANIQVLEQAFSQETATFAGAARTDLQACAGFVTLLASVKQPKP